MCLVDLSWQPMIWFQLLHKVRPALSTMRPSSEREQRAFLFPSQRSEALHWRILWGALPRQMGHAESGDFLDVGER